MKYIFYLGVVFWILLLFNVGLYGLFIGEYGIPFGQYDIDNYVCFLGMDLSERYDCPLPYRNLEPDPIHAGFLEHVSFLLNFGFNISWGITTVVLFYTFIFLPFAARYFYTVYFGEQISFYLVLGFFLGCFTWFFFDWMGLYSQLLSFCFWVLSQGFLGRKNSLFWPSALLSFLMHPYVLAIYGLQLLAFCVVDRKYYYIILGGLMFSVLYWITGGDFIWRSTVFFTNHVEPSIYQVFYTFTNPILTIFFFIGFFSFMEFKKDYVFVLLLLITAPISHYSRLLPYLQLFMLVYGYRGFRLVVSMIRLRGGNVLLFKMVVLFLSLLWFNDLYDYFLDNLIEEMIYLRGLDTGFLVQLTNYHG